MAAGLLKYVKKIHILLVVLLAALIVVSLYNRGVIQGFVGGSNAEFTMYYVDWCPHCKNAKPIFKDFMGSGSVSVNGKQVACKMIEAEQDPESVKGLNIKGYPTFMLNKGGDVIEYNGPRTADGWMGFLKQNV